MMRFVFPQNVCFLMPTDMSSAWTLTVQLREIAQLKMEDLNTADARDDVTAALGLVGYMNYCTC